MLRNGQRPGEAAQRRQLKPGNLSRAKFFESDPSWILSEARLVLAAGETTIELRERD
jgi:hypothetical protein